MSLPAFDPPILPPFRSEAQSNARLAIALGRRSYPIDIGRLDWAELAQGLPAPGRLALIVSNVTVDPLWGDRLQAALRPVYTEVERLVLPDGEVHKDWGSLQAIQSRLAQLQADRRVTLFALGGGVVGDLTGFAAAVWMRGARFVQVPTTLLAQVDSSVGGKTGINHPLGKNMIGAFYQPQLVLADTDTLNTLPDRELSAGLAEVIKYGLIRDLPFLEWLEANMEQLMARDTAALTYAIRRSCENKAEVVAADEKEAGQRALLNLGHTFGHAIEAGMGYGNWLHGEAVAAGTILAADLSRRLGNLSQADEARIAALFRRAGLPVRPPDLGEAAYMDYMGVDKKVEGGKIRFVLFRRLGEAYVAALGDGTGAAALKATLTEAVG